MQRRSSISNWTATNTLIGNTPIPPEAGTTITGAIANLYTTVTITIYSAANDTVTWTDLAGTHTVTTNASGQSGSVQIRSASSSLITFTSSVAKNPTNLSNNYSKSVTVTNSTTAIYVMPDKCAYWYGWKYSTITGYAIGNHSGVSRYALTLSFSTNSFTAALPSGVEGEGIFRTDTKLSGLLNKSVHCISAWVGSGSNNQYQEYAFGDSNAFISSPINVDSAYLGGDVYSGGRSGQKIYQITALWAE